MLSEHGGKRLRAGAAAGKVGGVEPIGHFDGNPDRRAVTLPLRPYDDVGGDGPLLLVQGDTPLSAAVATASLKSSGAWCTAL